MTNTDIKQADANKTYDPDAIWIESAPMESISIADNPELRQLKELGVVSGLTCGLGNRSDVIELAQRCAEDMQRLRSATAMLSTK